MSITLIKNQAISFRLLTEIEADICECSYKPFCQKVNKFDISKYQIISSNLITNGEFNSLDGWLGGSRITATIVITNESAEDECDGSLAVSASGGTGPYTYSKDGITFQSSATFSALCVGCYNVIIKDSLGNLGFVTGCVDTNVVCGSYSGSETSDLLGLNTSEILNCLTSDFL